MDNYIEYTYEDRSENKGRLTMPIKESKEVEIHIDGTKILTVDDLQNCLMQCELVEFGHIPQIICGNGYKLSVQVGKYLYCRPRNSVGPWESVEVMLIENTNFIPDGWEEHYDTISVFANIPIELVAEFIADQNTEPKKQLQCTQ